MCSRECGKHFNGCVKVSIFFQQSHCATSMGVSVWRGVGPATFLLCLVNILNFSWSRWPQNDTARIFFRNRYAQQGLIHKRLNKVCDSFEMLCSNCLNHWEYLLWEKGLGTKLYDGKSVLKMWKCPYGLKKHLAKNWKCCFLFIWPSSVALMKVRTSQADVFIEVDHQVQRMGLLVVAC